MNASECISAMQKCIRRGLEREAMEFACELMHSTKGYFTWVTNRLEIISHEDIDTAASPHIVPFVHTAMIQARAWYDAEKPDKSRLAVGNAIRMMCRAPKSREGDHFQGAVGLRSLAEGYCPPMPDWGLDMHTAAGKRMGRSWDHFLSEGVKLFPPPAEKDRYQDEAHRLWMLDEQGRHRPRDVGAAAVVAAAEQGKLALPEAEAATDPDLSWLEAGRPLAAPLTPAIRKRLAEQLYGSGSWTMQRIAKALGVSAMQVSRDLDGFNSALKPPRPKGGRPKGR
jgi:hypothetical protein